MTYHHAPPPLPAVPTARRPQGAADRDPEAAIRWPRRLVITNAVLWSLFLPAVAVTAALATWLFGGSPSPWAFTPFLVYAVVAAGVNVAGCVALGVAHRRLGGAAVPVVVGAVIQFAAVTAGAALGGYHIFLEAFDRPEADTAFITAIAVCALLYLPGQVITATGLRTLSRRLAVGYGLAPLLLVGYAAMFVLMALGLEPYESQPLTIVFVVILALAFGFFVTMPVIWFRLAAHLRRRARTEATGGARADRPPI
jgi:hypothetical protein